MYEQNKISVCIICKARVFFIWLKNGCFLIDYNVSNKADDISQYARQP
jgi:hypothetical protein